ncbi:MAG: DUF3604 domain-containing protein [Gemmatimonadota bacterium]|nr:DUF3604 domain-containing protein [Gemmatimonadota bacterium]
MASPMNRRTWIKSSAGYVAASGLLGGCAPGEEGRRKEQPDETGLNVYFGDIHNHNSVGYARGTMERAYEIAAGHLDFFAFTPHSHWPDVPIMEQDKHMKWLDGFEVTRRRWPDVIAANKSCNEPGAFVVFHAYEWHSSEFGDYVILFPGDDEKLTHFDKLEELQEFAFEKGALLIPHHPAYRQGRRGANPKFWDPRVTQLLEIFSEHGNAECDEGPGDYIRHSMGGRWSANTLQAILKEGHRVGVLASTDDHLGCPGAYGEGLAAVLAPELTREAVFDALKKRRCYGVTGDRIAIDFRLNGHLMGEETAWREDRSVYAAVSGWDRLDRVELLRNNRVVHRDFPMDKEVPAGVWDRPLLLRVELGWGPWGSLDMARVCDWEMDIGIKGGKIIGFQPCFQAGPLEEERRNRVRAIGDNTLRLSSYTSRRQAFEERPTNAVVLKLTAGPEAMLEIDLKKPSAQVVRRKLAGLLEAGDVIFTGPFPDESILVHRLVPETLYESSFTLTDRSGGETTDWYYLRVVQANGQMAWSSPIWVERKGVAPKG